MCAQFLIFTAWLFLPDVGSYYVIWHLSMGWIGWHWHLFISCILSALNKHCPQLDVVWEQGCRDCFQLPSAQSVEVHLHLVTRAIRAELDPFPVSSRFFLSKKTLPVTSEHGGGSPDSWMLFCLSCACSGPEEPAVSRHIWVVCRALCTKRHLLCFHNSNLYGLWVTPASLHQIKGFRSQHYWSTTMLLISAKDLF